MMYALGDDWRHWVYVEIRVRCPDRQVEGDHHWSRLRPPTCKIGLKRGVLHGLLVSLWALEF
jgi:hypothetical protein